MGWAGVGGRMRGWAVDAVWNTQPSCMPAAVLLMLHPCTTARWPQVLDEQLTDLLRCLPDNPAMHEKVWGGRGMGV